MKYGPTFMTINHDDTIHENGNPLTHLFNPNENDGNTHSKEEEEEEADEEEEAGDRTIQDQYHHRRRHDRILQKLQQKEEKLLKIHMKQKQTNKFEFQGQHKWLGGGIDPQTGYIYGVPSHASFVLCIVPTSSSQEDGRPTIAKIHLPEEYRHGHFKWLRCIIYQGYMYGIPAWSTKGVLKVKLFENKDPILLMENIVQSRQRVSILPLPYTTSIHRTQEEEEEEEDVSISILEQQRGIKSKDRNNEKEVFVDRRNKPRTSPVDRTRWQWHGGQIGINIITGEKAIYCPPSNAQRVLKICLQTDTVSEIGPRFYQGQNKFYGGILGNDGCIYGICYTAQQILRINPTTDEVKLIGPVFPQGGYKWHGGLKAYTGVIYAFPAHANTVLCINTNPKSSTSTPSSSPNTTAASIVETQRKEDDIYDNSDDWRVYNIPIHRGKEDTDSLDLKYKWLGGSYGANGNIYGMPSDANSILCIDPGTDTATTFGHVDGKMNKFQSGVLCPQDNCIYAVAADMDCILRIKTDPNQPVVADTICGGLGDVEDKFQGGFLANDGKIYCIPENIPHVMVLSTDEPRVDFIK